MSVILFTTKSIVSTRSLSCVFALQEFVFISVLLRGCSALKHGSRRKCFFVLCSVGLH